MELLEVEAIKCWDVILIALVLFGSDLFMFLWKRSAEQMSPEEQKLLHAYNQQIHVVNRLNSIETFVEQSKAIRKMNAIKKEMQDLAVERLRRATPSSLQKRIGQLRTPVIMVCLALYYWNEPLVVLPAGYFVPFERFLAFPGFPFGAISAVGWAGVCRRVGTQMFG